MSAIAVQGKLSRGVYFYQSTIGKKAVMAVTGLVLFGYLVGHLAGNLQIFLGPEKINNYAELLHSLPAGLWAARAVLLACVGLHIVASVQLWMLQRQARPVSYYRKDNIGSSYASRTMMWGGPIIAAFVVYHVLHFTTGTVHPDFRLGPSGHVDVYANVVNGFRIWPVSAFYVLAMLMLGLHLYHGLWSMIQSLGINHPRYTPLFKRFAAVFAVVIAGGNILIPVSVLAGWVG